MMVDSEERSKGRPVCEQLDLHPSGGDLVPDRYGLASHSAACLPPGVAEFFKDPAGEESACDKAYRELEQRTGMPVCEAAVASKNAVGVLGVGGGFGKWVSSRFAAVLGRKAVASPAPPKLSIINGRRGKPLTSASGEEAAQEAVNIATSGRAGEAFTTAMGFAQVMDGRKVIPYIIHNRFVLVTEVNGSTTVQVFFRDGSKCMGFEKGLPLKAELDAITQAAIRIVTKYFNHPGGGAGNAG